VLLVVGRGGLAGAVDHDRGAGAPPVRVADRRTDHDHQAAVPGHLPHRIQPGVRQPAVAVRGQVGPGRVRAEHRGVVRGQEQLREYDHTGALVRGLCRQAGGDHRVAG
jgi:hypothetical protein